MYHLEFVYDQNLICEPVVCKVTEVSTEITNEDGWIMYINHEQDIEERSLLATLDSLDDLSAITDRFSDSELRSGTLSGTSDDYQQIIIKGADLTSDTSFLLSLDSVLQLQEITSDTLTSFYYNPT
eukprot:Awhi_evm2s191